MRIGVILAGGKGKRFGAEAAGMNKAAALLSGKPLVRYGAELFSNCCDRTVVVVGSGRESIESALAGLKVTWAQQTEAKGTGHAAKVAVDAIKAAGWKPKVVVVGYGDHMMFYSQETVCQLAAAVTGKVAVAMVVTDHPDPDSLAWGRVIRDKAGNVIRIVEQKDATPAERKVTELNAGFYAFDYVFAAGALAKIKPSAVTGEYYLTDLIGMAVAAGRRVAAVEVPFKQVGYGVNTREDLEKSGKLMRE